MIIQGGQEVQDGIIKMLSKIILIIIFKKRMIRGKILLANKVVNLVKAKKIQELN